MTHRGSFQPLTLCHSILHWHEKGGKNVPVATLQDFLNYAKFFFSCWLNLSLVTSRIRVSLVEEQYSICEPGKLFLSRLFYFVFCKYFFNLNHMSSWDKRTL